MSQAPPVQAGISDSILRRMVRRRPPDARYLFFAVLTFVATTAGLGWSVLGGDNAFYVGVWLLFSMLAGGFMSATAFHDDTTRTGPATVTFLNVVSDVIACTAVALWARERDGSDAALAIGFLAAAGALMVGYSHVRILSSSNMDLPDGPFGVASREVRMLLLVLGVWAGQSVGALVLTAALAHLAVAGHLLRLRMTLRG
jgi:hypothetical protein